MEKASLTQRLREVDGELVRLTLGIPTIAEKMEGKLLKLPTPMQDHLDV